MADFTATYQDLDIELPRIQYLLGDNQWVDALAVYDGVKNPLIDTYQGLENISYSGQKPSYGVLYPPR